MNTFADRNRDLQDFFERHVFSEVEYTDTGAIIKVKGNGTEDEAVVINLGTGFNLEKDSNAEVMLLASGSDTGLKLALMTIPRDKQVKWEPGTGGIQNPTDPEKRIQFDEDGVWVKESTVFLGPDKQVKISIDDGKLSIDFSGEVVINSSKLTHNDKNIGSDHQHGGVERGGSETTGPV
jgi:hypothetical protein